MWKQDLCVCAHKFSEYSYCGYMTLFQLAWGINNGTDNLKLFLVKLIICIQFSYLLNAICFFQIYICKDLNKVSLPQKTTDKQYFCNVSIMIVCDGILIFKEFAYRNRHNCIHWLYYCNVAI